MLEQGYIAVVLITFFLSKTNFFPLTSHLLLFQWSLMIAKSELLNSQGIRCFLFIYVCIYLTILLCFTPLHKCTCWGDGGYLKWENKTCSRGFTIYFKFFHRINKLITVEMLPYRLMWSSKRLSCFLDTLNAVIVRFTAELF